MQNLKFFGCERKKKMHPTLADRPQLGAQNRKPT
jgi:hypothetical protein